MWALLLVSSLQLIASASFGHDRDLSERNTGNSIHKSAQRKPVSSVLNSRSPLSTPGYESSWQQYSSQSNSASLTHLGRQGSQGNQSISARSFKKPNSDYQLNGESEENAMESVLPEKKTREIAQVPSGPIKPSSERTTKPKNSQLMLSTLERSTPTAISIFHEARRTLGLERRDCGLFVLMILLLWMARMLLSDVVVVHFDFAPSPK